jgi:hypothetical protein
MAYRYIYSKDNKVVVCLQISKGEEFKGIARCSENDELNLEIGKRLAEARCDLAIRSRDLEEIRTAKEKALGWSEFGSCKLYTLWYQDACRVEKLQLEHIRNLKDKIKNLSNGIIK